MLDWIGSLRVRVHSSMRVELSLSRSTQLAGIGLIVVGMLLLRAAWSLSPWLLPIPVLLASFGGLLVTLRRRLIFDRSAGLLRMEQGALGVVSRTQIPLFHLRAVVVMARGDSGILPWMHPARYLAYLDRRVGEAIYLDEARRCATLLPMAEAIAEVAELRLEYDATSHASSSGG